MYRSSSSLCPSPSADQGRSFSFSFIMVQFLKKILPLHNHLYFNKILTFFLEGNIGGMNIMDDAISIFKHQYPFFRNAARDATNRSV